MQGVDQISKAYREQMVMQHTTRGNHKITTPVITYRDHFHGEKDLWIDRWDYWLTDRMENRAGSEMISSLSSQKYQVAKATTYTSP
jgi:hypothetical protein